MSKFLDLLERSLILQGVITLSFVGLVIYLVVVGRPIPDIVEFALGTIIGFFFGVKMQHEIDTAYRARNRK